MRTVEPGMNVARQRRKIAGRMDAATDDERDYLNHLLALFDAAVERGEPQPASVFIPMFDEEFDK